MDSAPKPATRLTGEIVYLYAHDIAYEMSRTPVAQLLGHPVTPFKVDTGRRGPRHLLFHQPQTIRLPVKLLPTGRCDPKWGPNWRG